MGASTGKGKAARTEREARLAAALRENLRKRKAQSRGRAETGASDPVDPPEEAKDRES